MPYELYDLVYILVFRQWDERVAGGQKAETPYMRYLASSARQSNITSYSGTVVPHHRGLVGGPTTVYLTCMYYFYMSSTLRNCLCEL